MFTKEKLLVSKYNLKTVVVPFTTIVFALSYGIVLQFGLLGIIGFASVGFLWALFPYRE
jgi:hypothetical protein